MMKDYRRMMEQVTLSDRKKEEIMDMLEKKQPQKRRMTPVTKLLLAAALAVGCVLSIAAGLPGQVYNFFSGVSVNIMPAGADGSLGGAEVALAGDMRSPIVQEDGKLWFVNDKERTDITNLIDENTPYIYEHIDPTTGNQGYVIVGGTVDHFGWAEYFESKDGIGTWHGSNYNDIYLTIDGISCLDSELTDAQRERINEMDGVVPTEVVCRPWFQSAMEQLGAW